MKDTFRRLRVRARERLESLRPSSEEVESLGVEREVASDRISTDSRQHHTENIQQKVRVNTAAGPGDTFESASHFDTNISPTENIDGTSWANVWPEAYQSVKNDPEHSQLLQKLEKFLESEGGRLEANGVKLWDDPSGATDDSSRLKTIQKNAEERLENLSEAHLSFKIRDKPIVVRESILKVVQVINTLKPVIGGAVAAEPSAALAWAGVTTILPMLENIFQQDENAATGLTSIIFLMARYQGFHERDFASQLTSPSESGVSRELLSRVRDELVSVYSKIYVYEARFILQYGKRNKAHRALRNALSADDWKKAWSDIESISNRIDKGITAQVNDATLETWKVVKDVQGRVARFEAIQNDFDRRQLLLSLQVTGNATYDSYRSSKVANPCLRGTQRHVLQTIQEWTEDPQGEMILWLEGMAGTGKTSVSLTVASALEARKPFTDTLERASNALLGASFFFSQSDTTRNNTFEFFRTIAWCLADISPEFGKLVADAIKDNPGIQTKVPLQQLQKLIVGPLAILDKSKFVPLCLVIVIDALDECDKNDAQELLGMLFHLQNLHQIQIRFLITSRPEEHIARSFVPLLSGLCRRIQLNKIKSATDKNNDIVYYLSETLKEIAKTQGVADDGVSIADITKLAEKADGLFIYAATACRFLAPNFAHKTLRDEHLALIFEGEIEEEGPQHKVDGIYFKVLAFPDIQKSHNRVQATFYAYLRRLIGFIVILFRPASVETLFHLLDTATEEIKGKTRETARRDLDGYLRRLYSIINVPQEPGLPLSLIHLSFRDFILNEKRSGQLAFCINENEMHQEVFQSCMDLMNYKLRQDICRLALPGTPVSKIDCNLIERHIPQYLRYASRYWVNHLSEMDHKYFARDKLVDDGIVHEFLKNQALYWMEVMALTGEASSIIPIITQLEGLIDSSENPNLSSLVYDLKRFILSNRWVIEHTPLQTYCSALLFSPKKSLVRLHYQHLIPKWINTRPETQEEWSSEVLALSGPNSQVYDTAFSPTADLIASIWGDNTIRIWDYVTGSEKYSFQDPCRPECVCFSMDNLRLASGGVDGTVCVRDIRKGTDFSFNCESLVVQISFSPTSSSILATLCDDGKVRIWNIDSNERVEVVKEFELLRNKEKHRVSERIIAMQISVDSRTIAIRLRDAVEFWDIAAPVPKLMSRYEVAVASYSPFLFLSTEDTITLHEGCSTTVEVVDALHGESIGKFLKSTKPWSHDGTVLAKIGGYHPTIRIYNGVPETDLLDEENSAPGMVEFVGDDSVGFDHLNGKTTKWTVVDGLSQPLQHHIKSIRYSPHRHLILLQLISGREFQVWISSMKQVLATFDNMAGMAFFPDGSHLAALSVLGEFQVLCYDSKRLSFTTVSRFVMHDMILYKRPLHYAFEIQTLYLSPSGQEAVTILDTPGGYDNQSCQLWNIAEKKRLMETHLERTTDVIFSPKNDFFGIQYGYEFGSTRLFQMSNGEPVVNWDDEGYFSLTFHPNGQFLAIIQKDRKTIEVWAGLPWTRHFMPEASQDYKIRNLAISATGKLAALSKSEEETRSLIDIWDIESQQKIVSQDLALSGYAITFCFAPEETCFETNRGLIPVPTQRNAWRDIEQPNKDVHKCLYVLDDWVFQGHERLIWLPSLYRPPTYRSKNVNVQGGMVALAHRRNSVKFIGVSLENTPVTRYYLGLGSR
ncbi:uncharacterized protein FPRN_11864 [Fusarium proliferatum]|nr:uncharacterized protein FPRN_11864 [Fusarium proliferatum]